MVQATKSIKKAVATVVIPNKLICCLTTLEYPIAVGLHLFPAKFVSYILIKVKRQTLPEINVGLQLLDTPE